MIARLVLRSYAEADSLAEERPFESAIVVDVDPESLTPYTSRAEFHQGGRSWSIPSGVALAMVGGHENFRRLVAEQADFPRVQRAREAAHV